MKNSSDLRIIVNADDFGNSSAGNKSILEAFDLGLLSSTTLLVNKQGFEEAINMVDSCKILKDRVGLHINLTDGTPLTDKIKKINRFCNAEGQYIYNRNNPCWYLSGEEEKAVYKEINAQVNKCIQHGVIPSHFDSHHHIHTEWAIAKIVAAIAKNSGINKIRLSRNTGESKSVLKKYYRLLLNNYFSGIARLTTADYFGSCADFLLWREKTGAVKGVFEIMVHAMRTNTGELVDYDQNNLSARLSPIISAQKMIGYASV